MTTQAALLAAARAVINEAGYYSPAVRELQRLVDEHEASLAPARHAACGEPRCYFCTGAVSQPDGDGGEAA